MTFSEDTVFVNAQAVKYQQRPEWCFSTVGLSKKETEEVRILATKLGAKFLPSWCSSVTHLIVKSGPNGWVERSEDYLKALVLGLWVVTSDWVSLALTSPIYIPVIPDYEALDAETKGKPGAQRTRKIRFQELANGGSRLLSNVEVCLVGELMSIDLSLFTYLVEESGGRLVSKPALLTSHPGRAFLVVDSPYHAERHRTELMAAMAATGALPVIVDYIVDSICAAEMLPVEGICKNISLNTFKWSC